MVVYGAFSQAVTGLTERDHSKAQGVPQGSLTRPFVTGRVAGWQPLVRYTRSLWRASRDQKNLPAEKALPPPSSRLLDAHEHPRRPPPDSQPPPEGAGRAHPLAPGCPGAAGSRSCVEEAPPPTPPRRLHAPDQRPPALRRLRHARLRLGAAGRTEPRRGDDKQGLGGSGHPESGSAPAARDREVRTARGGFGSAQWGNRIRRGADRPDPGAGAADGGAPGRGA